MSEDKDESASQCPDDLGNGNAIHGCLGMMVGTLIVVTVVVLILLIRWLT
jgi:hypothetical protein